MADKKPAAPKKAKAEPKAEAPKPLLEVLAEARERILDEREQYASPVNGRLTNVANAIESAIGTQWVDEQLKERSR